jgi:hypothetical protein
LARLMAELQQQHRSQGRLLSAAMVEALASAHYLNAGVAVSQSDVGPHLRASVESDGLPFYVI